MTEISFHVHIPDRVPYACRLLRKVVASGARAVVRGSPDDLQALDHSLWTFSALDFLPHCFATAPAAILGQTPIVLAEQLSHPGVEAANAAVLVNLGAELPTGFERYERVLELVSSDEGDLRHARQRWKHYADRGYALTRHDRTQR